MTEKNQDAVRLGNLRAAKLSPERRLEIAKAAAAKRWKGHKAARPASGRKGYKAAGLPKE